MKVIDGGRSAKTIADVLSGYEFHFADEMDLQAGIAEVLTNHGIPFEREVELCEVTMADAWNDRQSKLKHQQEELDTHGMVLSSARMENPHIGRIDFMVGSVGIEVKIGFSWKDVLTQLHRYAQADAITDLVLVTTRLQHMMPDKLNEKSLTVVNLGFTNSL